MAEFKYEVIQKYGIISESSKGCTKDFEVFVGTIKKQSMIFESGHRTMKIWEKA